MEFIEIDRPTTPDLSWSKVINTTLGDCARNLMNLNTEKYSLKYHIFNHVERIYHYALHLKIPYSLELDVAILFHDAIYDNSGELEIRSAKIVKHLFEMLPDIFDVVGYTFDIEKCVAYIISTLGHSIDIAIGSELIMLDLYELTNYESTVLNFNALITESMALYSIPVHEAAHGSLTFMTGFYNTINDNWEHDVDNRTYWDNVLSGVSTTIELAEDILHKE